MRVGNRSVQVLQPSAAAVHLFRLPRSAYPQICTYLAAVAPELSSSSQPGEQAHRGEDDEQRLGYVVDRVLRFDLGLANESYRDAADTSWNAVSLLASEKSPSFADQG